MLTNLKTHPIALSHSTFYTIALTAFLSACGTKQQPSTLHYAHFKAPQLTGTPMGHLELIDQGIPHKFSDNLRVCVQSVGDIARDQTHLFETKLAYTMWLSAARYGRESFGRLRFETASSCSTEDAQFMAVVIFGQISAEKPSDRFSQHFQAATMSCQADENSMSCQNDAGITLGVGRPATISAISMSNAPERWVQTDRTLPGSVLLSPHVDWMPLSYNAQNTKENPGSTRAGVITRYEQLVSTPSLQTFEALTSFANQLTSAEAISAPDVSFNNEMELLAQTKASVSRHVYRPRLASFHTLLHEVGHTFGMDHADHPGTDSITGPSQTTTCDGGGSCTTARSTMAYSDFYLYLTDDDQAGIQAAATAVKKSMAGRK